MVALGKRNNKPIGACRKANQRLAEIKQKTSEKPSKVNGKQQIRNRDQSDKNHAEIRPKAC